MSLPWAQHGVVQGIAVFAPRHRSEKRMMLALLVACSVCILAQDVPRHPAIGPDGHGGVLAVRKELAARARQDPRGVIHVSSPVPHQQLPCGQDLVVKYTVSADRAGAACRVVLIVNGRVLTTATGCRVSVAVPEHDLKPGLNTVELVQQDEDLETDQPETSVLFHVGEPGREVHPPSRKQCVQPWPELPGSDVDAPQCQDGDTCHAACVHRVGGTCILYDDRWARANGAIPRIFHWVWVGGGGEIPVKFQPMMESWRRLHPEWQTVVWTDDLITWPLRNQAVVLHMFLLARRKT